MTDLQAAEAGIRQLHSRYTDAVFRKDPIAFAECFAPDGEWRISGRVFRGREEIRDTISVILDNFTRVLISFRTPIVDVRGGAITARTYIDEKCAWKNGNSNISIGRYYERFAERDGQYFFQWRLFQILYRGPEDLSGDWLDQPDFGPPPGMPPRDADTLDTAGKRWGLSDGAGKPG